MDTKVLSQIIPAADAKDLEELRILIDQLESLDNLFVGFMLGHDNSTRFTYMSPSLEAVTGYPVSNFISEEGFKFLYTVTPNEYRAHIVERAAFYESQARQPGFSVVEPQLMEIHGGLYHRDGHSFPVRFLAVVLEYTRDRDLVLSLCTWQNIDSMSDPELDVVKGQVNHILASCKKTYMKIHPAKFTTKDAPGEKALKVVYPLYRGPTVTKKEYEVLCLIANGCSSKQIAHQLNISFHTAETHRKHLLGKFDAINSAELMKKASKVYWFE